MTISTTNITKSYNGNGSTHSFAYDFPIFADADLTVIVRSAAGTESTKTLNTHYIVTGAGSSSGGNVLFKFNTGTSSDAHYSATDHRPANGETVVIRSELANTQTLDLVANDPFPASSFEDALDRLVRMVQQHDEELDRSLKLSRTNTMTSTEFATSATDRASKVLAFDSSGELSVTTELGTFKGNWAASTTYAIRDIVKDTSTNNIFIATAAHTSSGSQPLTTNTDSAKWSLLVDAASATTSQTAAATSASTASDHRADAAKYAVTAHNSTFTLSSTNSGTSGLYSALHYATEAASSASTATSQATAATTAKTAAETALDSFDDRFLGAKGSDPSTDNDGNALLTSALYWNNSDGLKVYNGSAWVLVKPSSSEQANINTLAGISSDVTTLSNALSATTTYTVTVASVGGSNVFVLDGSNNPAIQLDRGNTYIFDQSDASNSGHTLAFKNGSSSYTTGVTTTGTAGQAGAKTTIIVDAGAPSSGLLYYCVAHGNAMGNSITTVTNNFSVVASNIGNINTVAGANTNIGSVAGSIANVNTVAGTLTAVNSFNDLFTAGSSAPSSPSAGDLWYDTANSQLKVYVGSAFQIAGAYLQGLTTTHVFTATSNQTTFTTDDASQTMSIHANGNTLVFKNGIRLVEGSNSSTNDYHISGNNVVLNAGATAGDILYVEVFTKISTTQEQSLNTLVSNATTQANTATTQATNAATSATNAAGSATTATNQATTATTQATNAASSATAAQTAQTAAETALDSFDDRYLGAKSSAPTTDNDGNTLLTGSIYWNSTNNKLNVWDGSAWQQGAFSAGSLLANVVEDTTPVLGGSLDVGTNSIVSVSNRDINITPNGSGSVVLDGLNYPQADGSAGQFLKTDGSGQLSFGTVSTPSLSSLGIANHDNLSVDGSGNVALGSSSIAFGSSKWTIVLDGNDLDFKYNGTTVFKLASNGAVTSADNITAYGSP
mgnify:CR=1 FL=1|tara:strand:- start:7 stop:2871 length:2865 start_codon:yes stop_codon:yes gene_type:complete